MTKIRKKKFKVKPFKNWLDVLCKVVVKTRDNFTCQKTGEVITDKYDCQWCHIKSRNSNNLRWNLCNTLTLSGKAHQWQHANPDEAMRWFARTYPARSVYISNPRWHKHHTWKEADFREVEKYLLGKAIDFNVDVMNLPEKYRKRFTRRVREYKKGLI